MISMDLLPYTMLDGCYLTYLNFNLLRGAVCGEPLFCKSISRECTLQGDTISLGSWTTLIMRSSVSLMVELGALYKTPNDPLG